MNECRQKDLGTTKRILAADKNHVASRIVGGMATPTWLFCAGYGNCVFSFWNSLFYRKFYKRAQVI
jgi:hypothetical protein